MRKFFSHPFILSLAIIGGLIFVNQQGWFGFAKSGLFNLTANSQRLVYCTSLKFNNLVNFFKGKARLSQENLGLKKENEQLFAQLAQLEEVGRENDFLCQQLGLETPEEKKLILANIVGQDSSNSGKYFLIDRGKESGVYEKATVVAAGNILVGQVVEVNDSFAKVQLITSPNSRVNALIQESGISGLVINDSVSGLIIDLLPQGRTIKEGELVVSSGAAGFFPSGLFIGRISRVISSDAQISQKAVIEPAIDFGNLDKVLIIR